MKKALLFIGLAMCTSIAFAQTNKHEELKAHRGDVVQSINLKEVALQNADYKASIFTKAAGDTIRKWGFNTQTQMDSVTYAADGLVTSGMTVNGVALDVNGATHPSARWQWIPDSNYFDGASFAATYPAFVLPDTADDSWSWAVSWLKVYLADEEDVEHDGFMFMELRDCDFSMIPATRSNIRPHAFFALPATARPAEDKVIDIAFQQIYWKFYDQTFIDYKINGQWKTRMINVDGVDATINYRSSYNCRYAMPTELGTQANIEIRFRYWGGNRSNAWGYLWGVDNVSFIAGGNNRMTADAEDWCGSGYGTIPQGMQIPISWAASVYNAGFYPLSNVTVNATHIASDGTQTEVATNSTSRFSTIAAGDPTVPTALYFDEQGLLYLDSLTDANYFVYMRGAYTGGHYMDSVMDPSLQYRSFPTANLGRNRIAVTATADSNLSIAWDTIAYRVVGYSTAEQLEVQGYRWGHDNGIIAAGDSYHYGLTTDGNYLSQDGNWNQNGYGVTVRYTPGPVVPVDDDGNPWVLRGVEIVTSPEHSATQLNGAKIRPVTYYDYYDMDEQVMYFLGIDNGVNNVTVTLRGADVENENPTGVNVADGETYQAANIFFPNQPELLPNVSYRVGYRLASSCTFSAATTRSSYAVSSERYYSYDSNMVSAPWKNQFWPNALDITVSDPAGNGLLLAGLYNNSYPMIRAIVGPREQLANTVVNVICDNEEEYTIEYGNEVVCGNAITVPVTSGPTFYVIPSGDHMVLDSLFIDGRYVPVNSYDDDGDDDLVVTDYSIYDTIQWWEEGDSVWTNLERYYWTYTFRNIDTNTHSIRATAHYEEWIPSGVDPVAPEVKMVLAPNPATSQVALNIKGVTGMVNCNIIDMSGRTVYARQIDAESANTIDLRNVPAGAYFVRITNDTFSKVEKLIVH